MILMDDLKNTTDATIFSYYIYKKISIVSFY